MVISSEEDSNEISGDYIYDCPNCNAKRSVSTSGDIPRPDDKIVCPECNKTIFVIDREVVLRMAKD